jgi:hypothetical protein
MKRRREDRRERLWCLLYDGSTARRRLSLGLYNGLEEAVDCTTARRLSLDLYDGLEGAVDEETKRGSMRKALVLAVRRLGGGCRLYEGLEAVPWLVRWREALVEAPVVLIMRLLPSTLIVRMQNLSKEVTVVTR